MFRNNLKLALRSFSRHRLHFLLNLSGLSLSLVCVLFVVFYIYDEMTFDSFHSDADQIYRIVEQESNPGGGDEQTIMVSFNASTIARNEIPEVENAVKAMGFGRTALTNEAAQISVYEPFRAFEQNFLEIFDFPLAQGDRRTALVEPNSIVLSQELARKLFGTEDAMGKVIQSDRGMDLTVTGILAPIPANSHLDISSMISHSTMAMFSWYERLAQSDYTSHNWLTYLKLKKGADPKAAESKLNELIASRVPEDAAEPFNSVFYLQPLRDIHFHSQGIQDDQNHGKSTITYIYLVAAIGLFILIIACINYINLATARASTYGKEVGVRKVVGATRGKLLERFLTESMLISVFAFLLAISLVSFLLPAFNTFMGKGIAFSPFGYQSGLFAGLLLLMIAIGFLSGLYPAFYLSRFNPVNMLKGGKTSTDGSFNLRRALVVFQFVLSMILITGTLVAYSQMRYIQSKNLGFNQGQLVVIDINSRGVRNGFNTIMEGYEQLPDVSQVTVSSRVPGEWKLMPEIAIEQPMREQEGAVNAFFIGGDENFLPTFEIDLLNGRNFDRGRPQDSTSVIINEQAAQLLGIEQANGQEIVIPSIAFGSDEDQLDQPFRARVIGIVSDFHFQSLHEPLRPLLIGYRNNPLHSIDYFTARIRPENIDRTIAAMTEVLHNVDPDHLFEYHFLDDQLQLFYEEDSRRGQLFSMAALFAIFIACLGLFGLAAFTAEQRTKEIGIRKVLGASVQQIVLLLSKEFVLLVTLSLIIGAPIAWWAAKRWLAIFAFHVDIQWWMFALPGLAAIGIALATVSLHAIRAAVANPVKALKDE